MIDLASEHGLAQATVARVVDRCGVSRRTYYELFPDREACFLAALEMVIERAGEYVLPAYDTPGSWREQVRGSLAGLLWFLEHEPRMGRLLIVESLAAGPNALKRRRELLDVLTTAIDRGRTEPRARTHIPRLTGEGTVGAVLSVLHTRLTNNQPHPLIELLGPLMGMILTPYLGPTIAQKETARPTPDPITPIMPANNTPLSDLPVRLTYRTITVLAAIATTPGASNRQIGHAAGIHDQGQTSKLLARLARTGLIENTGQAQTQGGPNAWTLTPHGTQIQHTIHKHTSG